MVKKIATPEKSKANASLSIATKLLPSKIEFSLSVDGETISTSKASVMIKLAESAVFLESVKDQDGQLILSRKRAKHMRTWEKILNAANDKEILESKIKRRTKGGFVVDIDGIEAFLPGMMISVDEKNGKDKTIKVRVLHSEPLKNALIVASAAVAQAEVSQMAAMLNMREIISLHIGQA